MPTRRLDRIAEPWGTRTPFASGGTWPVRVDMHLEDGADPDGTEVDASDADAGGGPLARVREKAADLSGGRPEGGLLLLRNWGLLDSVSRCHAQTLRGMKWTLTRLKTAAPQVLAG